ncbi:Ribose import binding protein RbsB [Paraburkholderia ultramafica]|uniref:Ribose import binding protein RbsB n=1 Tax=Paraburkholderia ultramafica TaxID=1544867 RepID=A0A6S7B6F0_9BURK|nr:substrate-binding domain-containing protein [Paraburkholderia ultramafica]CAB3779166.1 Ribose import binding protein RbsB [Paraburkholderia ultramafica]
MRVNTKKAITLAAVIAMAVGAVTSAGAQEAKPASPKGKVIGVTNRDMNEYFGTISNAIKAEGEKNGFTVILTDAQNDMTKQLKDCEDLLSRHIDFLVLNPQEPAEGAQCAKKANALKIPVITFDSGLQGNAKVLTQVRAQNYDGNVQTGEFAGKYMGNNPIKLAIVSGSAGNVVSQDRRTGFLGGFNEYRMKNYGNSNVNVVAQLYGNWNQNDGRKVMEDILVAHPDINMVYSESDAMVIGMIRAIKARNMQGKMKIFSFDGNKFAYKAIMDGDLVATGENSPSLIGKTVVDVLKEYVETGRRNFPDITYVRKLLVTKDNVSTVYNANSPF